MAKDQAEQRFPKMSTHAEIANVKCICLFKSHDQHVADFYSNGE